NVLSNHTDSVSSVAFSPDGQYVLTGSWDKTTTILDSKTHQVVRTFSDPNSVFVNSAAFGNGGQWVLTGTVFTANLWDSPTGELYGSLNGEPANVNVNSVAFSPDGNYVATGLSDNTAKVLNKTTGQSITLSGHTGVVNSVAFSKDSRLILTG